MSLKTSKKPRLSLFRVGLGWVLVLLLFICVLVVGVSAFVVKYVVDPTALGASTR